LGHAISEAGIATDPEKTKKLPILHVPNKQLSYKRDDISLFLIKVQRLAADRKPV
jgi:hypothetical protein